MASECVKVMVRCRPMNKKEKERGCLSVVEVDTKENQIQLAKPNEQDQSKVFSYDYTFGPETPQQTIYEETAFSLIESVVEGYNGTIFAYGQTGCGKTHTMMGDPISDAEKGIIPRSFQHIMNIISTANDKQFLVRCSYLEIYNEEIRDLLGNDAKAKVDLKESPDKGVFVKDLTQNIVKNIEEMEKWMLLGTKNRSTGETLMNKDSSRSHSIFTLYIEASINDDKGNERYTAGKLNLVDLAGSERQSKTGATGDRLKEASKINLSLSALGNVISALVDGKSQHIPYRDSKLTRLLQDSLGGNTKTIMIAAVSPADYNYDETLSTLRYASRAKNIKNKPMVNEDPKDAMLREYGEEIKKLKELLLKQQQGERVDINAEMLSSQKIVRGDSQFQNQIEAMRNEMEIQVKQKEEAFIREQQEKQKLEQMIKGMETRLMKGGGGDEQQKKKYSNLKSKLKQHEEQKGQLIKEKEKAENEVINLEKKFSNLQEENAELRKITVSFKKKFKQAQSEIRDIQKENELEKEDYLDLIRMQEKDMKLYQQICLMLLKTDEVEIIKSASEWNDERKEYKIPYFFFKERKLKFPKIQGAQELVEAEKENREMSFRQTFSRQRQDDSRGRFNEDYDTVDEMRQTSQKFIVRNTNKTLYGAGAQNGNGNGNGNGTKNSFYSGSATTQMNNDYDVRPKQIQKETSKVPKVQLDPLNHEARVILNQTYQQPIITAAMEKNKFPKSTAQLEPLAHQANLDLSHNQSQMNGTRNNFYANDENKQKMGKGMKLESLQNAHLRQASQNSQVQYDGSYEFTQNQNIGSSNNQYHHSNSGQQKQLRQQLNPIQPKIMQKKN